VTLQLKQGETVLETVLPGTYVHVPDLGHVYAEDGWANGDYSISVAPPIPPAPEPEKTLAEWAAELRWQREIGGVNIGGVSIMSDDRSKILIMGARMNADADPSFTTSFKTTGGTFTELNATQIVTLSDALAAHVAYCFEMEASALEQIASGTITTPEQLQTHFAG